MKKFLITALALSLAMFMFAGCTSYTPVEKEEFATRLSDVVEATTAAAAEAEDSYSLTMNFDVSGKSGEEDVQLKLESKSVFALATMAFSSENKISSKNFIPTEEIEDFPITLGDNMSINIYYSEDTLYLNVTSGNESTKFYLKEVTRTIQTLLALAGGSLPDFDFGTGGGESETAPTIDIDEIEGEFKSMLVTLGIDANITFEYQLGSDNGFRIIAKVESEKFNGNITFTLFVDKDNCLTGMEMSLELNANVPADEEAGIEAVSAKIKASISLKKTNDKVSLPQDIDSYEKDGESLAGLIGLL